MDEFHREAVAMVNMGYDWKRALQASRWLGDYFLGLIEQRRSKPGGDDLISVLIAAECEGDRLADADIVAFLRVMLPAGAETTYRSTSNLVQGLLTHPDQLAALRADRSLIPKAIEEGLRWEAPLTAIARTATRDVEIGGVEIPAGAMVNISIGAANHDHDRWGPTAEELDILRPSQAHLAFANGPHVCLGLQLARMESRVFLERLLERLPNLRLDPDADPARYQINGLAFRSPRELPVLFG
jgi:cytochrome P450